MVRIVEKQQALLNVALVEELPRLLLDARREDVLEAVLLRDRALS